MHQPGEPCGCSCRRDVFDVELVDLAVIGARWPGSAALAPLLAADIEAVRAGRRIEQLELAL